VQQHQWEIVKLQQMSAADSQLMSMDIQRASTLTRRTAAVFTSLAPAEPWVQLKHTAYEYDPDTARLINRDKGSVRSIQNCCKVHVINLQPLSCVSCTRYPSAAVSSEDQACRLISTLIK
jgi:hypothetical protein